VVTAVFPAAYLMYRLFLSTTHSAPKLNIRYALLTFALRFVLATNALYLNETKFVANYINMCCFFFRPKRPKTFRSDNNYYISNKNNKYPDNEIYNLNQTQLLS